LRGSFVPFPSLDYESDGSCSASLYQGKRGERLTYPTARARAHRPTHRRTCVSLSSSLAGFFQVARRSSIAYASLTKSAILEPFFRFLGC
jgi:hypothetical protein